MTIWEFAANYELERVKAWAATDLFNLQSIVNYLGSAEKIYICGNGGSAAIANHWACDAMKANDHDVESLCANQSVLTMLANDFGYDSVFDSQLKRKIDRFDAVILISSSGKSPNVIRACETANKAKVTTISLTGFSGGPLRAMSKYNIHVPSENYGIVEDIHHSIMHIIAQHLAAPRA